MIHSFCQLNSLREPAAPHHLVVTGSQDFDLFWSQGQRTRNSSKGSEKRVFPEEQIFNEVVPIFFFLFIELHDFFEQEGLVF